MKVCHNLGYSDIFNKFRFNRKLIYIFSLIVVTIVSLIYLANIWSYIVVALAFMACVASMQHLKYANWLGIDLNLILTVLITQRYGMGAGSIIGFASTLGLVLAGDIDSNLFYDYLMSMVVVLLAIYMPLHAAFLTSTILWFVCGITYHKLMDSLEVSNIMWFSIYLVFNLIVYKYFILYL